MKYSSFLMIVLCCGVPGLRAGAILVNLGNASPYAVLAGSTVTNTGPTTVFGNLGVWPGGAVTGFPPGLVSGGVIHANDANALQAQLALTTAYNAAGSQACDADLTGQDLGGQTLTSGVYCFTSSAQLTGTLTLDAQGNANSAFVFKIGSTLTTASASAILLANAANGDGIFWRVGSSATLGTTTAFAGNILASASITLNTGANIQCGRALASSGAVTMDSNQVSITGVGCANAVNAVPEPASGVFLGMGLLLFGLPYARNRMRLLGR